MTAIYEKMIGFLRQTDQVAADQTLGLALMAEQKELLPPLVSALIYRSSDDALSYAVRSYHKLQFEMQQSILSQGPAVSGALRLASRDADPQSRLNVISIVTAGNYSRLAYLLSFLFHDEVPGIRAKAATAYKTLAQRLMMRVSDRGQAKHASANESGKGFTYSEELSQFFATLGPALDSFPNHLRTEVVEAAMYFAPILPDSTWEKFTGERNRIGRVAVEILQRDSNPCFAGFAFRALTDMELGKHVARIIAAACNGDFMRQWLSFAWYRHDLNVRKNLARINKDFRWLAGNCQPLLETPSDLQMRFVDVLMLTSIPASGKLDLLGSLLMAKDPMVQEHVVATLISSDLPETDKVLMRVTSLDEPLGFSARAARMAMRYLRRHAPDENREAMDTVPANVEPGIEQYFDQFWLAFANLDIPTSRAAIERLQRLDERFLDRVREKLESADPVDRARAVNLIRRGRLAPTFRDDIYRLCADIDLVTRASAVSALGDIPGYTTEQKIIEALDDEDPRVQANAVEALEAANPPDMLNILEGKLSSPNNRIRANAIKAILRPQYTLALKALAAMLDHPDPTFRRSALWAVLKTTPFHLGAKVNNLAKNDPDPEIRDIASQAMGAMVESWKESRNLDDAATRIGARS